MGNWGAIETGEYGKSQPEGRKARLSLLYRDTTEGQVCSARRVDVAKLLEDTKAYLKSRPQDHDWEKSEVGNIGQRLLKEGGLKYLSVPVAHWTQDLQPAAKHWDKRIEIETPLSEAGAYLVEVSFNGEHTSALCCGSKDWPLCNHGQRALCIALFAMR